MAQIEGERNREVPSSEAEVPRALSALHLQTAQTVGGRTRKVREKLLGEVTESGSETRERKLKNWRS